MNPPVGGLRATWLLTRLLVLRMKNLVLSGFQRKKEAPGPRTATRSKGGTSWVLLALCLVLWVPGIISAMSDVVANLRMGVASRPLAPVAGPLPGPSPGAAPGGANPARLLTDPAARHEALRELMEVPPGAGSTGRPRVFLPPEPGRTESAPSINVFSLVLCCALLVALHGLLMAPDLWRVEWSLEWLFTLPLPLPTLLFVRTVASTLSNLAGYFLVAPLLGVVAWDAGHRWAAPVLALGLTTPLIALIALARQVFEISLRLSLDPARLRNVQAAVTVGGFGLWLPAMFALSPAAQDPDHVAFQWLRATPDLVRWLPPGLAIGAVTATDPLVALAHAAGVFVEVGAAMVLAFAYLNRRLAAGLMSGGAREVARAFVRDPAPLGERRFLTPFQAKTLSLLARDRNMAVTVFGLPAFVIAQQYVLFGDVAFLSSPERVGAAAFAVGAMALAMALPQVLLKEAETFWLLKTFPRPVEHLLAENAVLWGGMMTIYPVIGLVLGMRHVTAPPEVWIPIFLLVILGMAAYTVTATGLALLSSNPTATDTRKQLSPWGMWLYMVLVGVYLQALVSGDPWRMLGGFMLASMLAYAFWQKICDHLPYMLDPTAEPPARISLADGLIAAEIFFILQAVAMASMRVTTPSLRQLLPGFTLAGAVTCSLAILSVWQLRIRGLPRLLGPGGFRACAEALAGGAAAGAFGLAYIHVIRKIDRLASLIPLDPPLPPADLPLLLVLGVFAAPVFEEIIFRGLVYTGLRRSLPRASSILACALLFGVLHPPHAFVPVFGMALVATALFERHRLLVAPILAHAVYNACVLFMRTS